MGMVKLGNPSTVGSASAAEWEAVGLETGSVQLSALKVVDYRVQPWCNTTKHQHSLIREPLEAQ